MDDQVLLDILDSISREIVGLRQEVKDGFTEVKQHLVRIDSTLVMHGRQVAAGARAIAGFNEWVGKADTDYSRVLEELADLKLRVAKLEHPEATQ